MPAALCWQPCLLYMATQLFLERTQDSETLSSVYERRHSKSLTVVCQARRSGGGSPHHSTGRHHVRSTSRTL